MNFAEGCAIGHPDKVCDQISDAILDAFLAEDPQARVDCTALLSHRTLLISGEVTSTAQVDVEHIAKEKIREIGYDPALFTTTIELTKQSEDIKDAIVSSGRLGAGDQGIMVGYATDETKECMPLAVIGARSIVQRLAEKRPLLGPDGKCLVGATSTHIDFIIISSQHQENVPVAAVREEIRALIPQEYL